MQPLALIHKLLHLPTRSPPLLPSCPPHPPHPCCCHALIPGPYSQSPSLLKASRRGLEGDILSCTDPPAPVLDSPVNSRTPRSNPRSSCQDLPIIPQPPNLLCAAQWLPNGTHMSHRHTCHITPVPHSP